MNRVLYESCAFARFVCVVQIMPKERRDSLNIPGVGKKIGMIFLGKIAPYSFRITKSHVATVLRNLFGIVLFQD